MVREFENVVEILPLLNVANINMSRPMRVVHITFICLLLVYDDKILCSYAVLPCCVVRF